jgi:DNA-binding transcriptional MerR regulator
MQHEMFFDGDDYVHDRDKKRLGTQLDQIRDFMEGKEYLTLQEISDATGHPHSSVSAQIRNLRKERFGSRVIDRKYISNGLYSYKLMPEDKHASI